MTHTCVLCWIPPGFIGPVDRAILADGAGGFFWAVDYRNGLDTPFIDAVPEGMLAGKGAPAEGTPPALPFAVHHHMLTQAGIHHLENIKLDELARDRVWLSCTMILPLREKGAAGSPIRPVAIGAATQAVRK